MTGQDRSALLLAARLLEAGIDVQEAPELGAEAGHVSVGFTLAGRLSKVTEEPERVREIVASLRAAAEEDAAAERSAF
jgi:hypothetical protein